MKSTPMRINTPQRSKEWFHLRIRGTKGNPYPCALGASDAPVIMGTIPDRFGRDVYQLWRERSGLRVGNQKPNYGMIRGTRAEPFIRAEASLVLQTHLEPAVFTSTEAPWLVASLDGYNTMSGVVAEMKLAARSEYEACMRGEIPEWYVTQCRAQMFVMGIDKMYLCICDLETAGLLERGARVKDAIGVFPIARWGDREGAEYLMVSEEFCLAVEEGFPLDDTEMRKRRYDIIHGRRVVPTRWRKDGYMAKKGDEFDIPLFDDDDAEPIEESPAEPHEEADFGDPFEGIEPVPAAQVVEAPIDPDAVVSIMPLIEERHPWVVLSGWVKRRDEVCAKVLSFRVTDHKSAQDMAEMLSELTASRRAIEKAKLEATAKYREQVDIVNDAVREFCRPVNVAEGHAKDELEKYRHVTTARAEREHDDAVLMDAKIAAAAAKMRKAGKPEDEVQEWIASERAAIIPAEEPEEKLKGVAVTEGPEFEITDESRVSRDLCSPDPRKIKDELVKLWDESQHNRVEFESRAKARYSGIKAWIKASYRKR